VHRVANTVVIVDDVMLSEGRMNDDATLRDNKVTNGSKIMVVGSTINDVLAVTEPALNTNKQNDKFEPVSSKEPFCKQKVGDTSLNGTGLTISK